LEGIKKEVKRNFEGTWKGILKELGRKSESWVKGSWKGI
jgi:hypothetical protein